MKQFFEMFRLLIIGMGIISIVSCKSTKQSSAALPPAVGDPDIFRKTVRPILEHRCIQCHNDKKPNAGLNFQNQAVLFAKSERGSFIDPGSPETSRIYQAIIKPKTHPGAMPGDGWGIETVDIYAFRSWIKDGAPWPKGEKSQLVVKDYEVRLNDYQ